MIAIRPISDLRNKFPKVEETVLHTGTPVFLTKNGRESMVLMSIEQYSTLIENPSNTIEALLDEADHYAQENPTRLTHQEVFAQARGIISEALQA